jgi:hypothetical protein
MAASRRKNSTPVATRDSPPLDAGPRSAVLRGERSVGRSDLDHDLSGRIDEAVGDDVVELSAQSTQPFPVAAVRSISPVRPRFDVGTNDVDAVAEGRRGRGGGRWLSADYIPKRAIGAPLGSIQQAGYRSAPKVGADSAANACSAVASGSGGSGAVASTLPAASTSVLGHNAGEVDALKVLHGASCPRDHEPGSSANGSGYTPIP